MNILAAANKAFGTNHFIFLGICIVYIIGSLILLKKFKVPFKTVLIIMMCICIASELIKVTDYLEPYYNDEGIQIGVYFRKTGLPFHLCSIQIVFIFMCYFLKDESKREKLLSFIFPTAVLGASISLILATITIEFDRPLAYQYFIYHASLIIFGAYIVISKAATINFKSYIRTCLGLLLMFFLSIYINGILSDANDGYYTYFMYSTEAPLENLPILNFKNGWGAYALSIMTIGIVLMTMIHLPFIIKECRLKKKMQNTMLGEENAKN